MKINLLSALIFLMLLYSIILILLKTIRYLLPFIPPKYSNFFKFLAPKHTSRYTDDKQFKLGCDQLDKMKQLVSTAYGQKLKIITYGEHVDGLPSSEDGAIDVIDFEINLRFENSQIFIRWASFHFWDQYVLDVSDSSFLSPEAISAVIKDVPRLSYLLGLKLVNFSIFGEVKNLQNIFTQEFCGNEPHLFRFEFSENKQDTPDHPVQFLFLANFSFNLDFDLDHTSIHSDEIWITDQEKHGQAWIDKFGYEQL